MKKKAMPPMAMTAGQCGRILFNFTLPEGTAMPELVGALMVHGQRVDMVREAEDRLLIPVCPPGVYLAEVRAAGVCVLYGHVEVLPSPLYEQDGVVCYTIDVDAMTDVLAVSLSMVEGIPGPRGEQGIQGERGLQGASAYDLAVAAGYEGSEAEWVEELQGAQAAANAAKESETAAAKSAREAAADKTAAELARDDAQAAQKVAAAKAEKATEAAEAAQAPESIAAQSARPATMLLVRDELMSILGDASLFDIDTDGQKIIVHTDRLSDDKLAAVNDMLERFVPGFIEVEQYNHHIEVSWRVVNKYAECKDGADMLEVNPLFRHDVTSDLEWVYPLPELQKLSMGWQAGVFANRLLSLDQPEPNPVHNKAEKVILNIPQCTDGTYGFIGNGAVREIEINAPKLTRLYYAIRQCGNLTSVKGYLPNLTDGQRGLGNEAPKLSVFDIELPSLIYGRLAFQSAILNKKSTLKILNSIPSYTSGTHELTIGIHIDHQQDEEVLAAIANAEAKGWTLAVQWNGTPTVATASTFGFGQLIYAKEGEIERPDGTTERVLDWGHYVTDETGYETFRSLESAYEYYQLPAEEGGEE